MLGKPDPDPKTSAACYGFALGLSLFLFFQSFTLEATKKQNEDIEISLTSRDVPAYVLLPGLVLIGVALGIKIPPDLMARLLGSRSTEK